MYSTYMDIKTNWNTSIWFIF